MRPGSVRSRILFIAMFPALTIALILGTYFGHTRIRDMEQNLQERGQAVVKQFAPACQYGVFSGNLQHLEPMVTSLLSEPDIVSVIIRDAEGKVLLSRSRQENDAGRLLWFEAGIPAPTLPLDDEVIETTGQAAETSSIGSVAIGISTASLLRRTEQVMQKSLVLILLGLSATFALAALIARTLVRPIERITHAVDRIAAGEFDVRLMEPATGELQRLQEGINEMAQRLGQTQKELQQEVLRATGKLRQALETMEEKNRQLDHARQEAQRASRERTELIANMSHEIRTPLNGILGFIDLMLRTPLSPEQREYVGTIRKSANNLLAIVNDILDFSRIESGKLRLEPVPFDLREPIEDTLDLLSPLAGEKRLELVLLIYEDVPTRLVGDVDRLRQILLNLIGNAVKFTHSGSIVVRVMLEDDDGEECRLRISITDTGIGMNEAQQRTLFRAFSQGHGSLNRLYGGTGLGLFISRMLVEQMGGEIGLESREGKGSTFWFTLRLNRQPGDAPRGAAAPGPLRIHLYCAHELASRALVHPLRRWGIQVVENSSLEALENHLAAERSEPDQVLVLLSLTGSENEEPAIIGMIRRVRRHGFPVAVLTSVPDKQRLGEIESAGAAFCLDKPVRLETLRSALWRHRGWTDMPEESLVERRRRPRVIEADLSDVRILVADDSEINRRLILHQLAPLRVQVVEAADGEEALRIAKRQAFDLILMDIRMPAMTGEEVCRRIRHGENPNRDIPIIALTANTLEGEAERLSGFGISETLIKPVSEYRLLECLAHWLKRQDLRRSLTAQTRPRRSLVEEMRERLIAELPDHRQALVDAFDAGGMDALRDAAHRLAGSAAWCQLAGLQEAATALEQACLQQKSGDQVARSLDACLMEIDALQSKSQRQAE